MHMKSSIEAHLNEALIVLEKRSCVFMDAFGSITVKVALVQAGVEENNTSSELFVF